MERKHIETPIKTLVLLLLILVLFPVMFILFYLIFGIANYQLLYLMIYTIIFSVALMGAGLIILFTWYEYSSRFIKHAVLFLCFNYNENSKKQIDRYWPIRYFTVTGIYFFTFAIFFFFSGFENISQVIYLCWFGIMLIRLLHFVIPYNTCKQLGELLFSTLIPFGILLEIGLLFFKHYTVIWGEMNVYIFFSVMFLLSTLFTEIVIGFFLAYLRKKGFLKIKL